MQDRKRAKLIKEVLGNQRNPKQEVQALQDTIYVISGKWKLPVIYSICSGNRRFTDIERSIPGISPRMLSRELKELEANQIIRHAVDPNTPGIVEYFETEYCFSFSGIILEMIKWGKDHLARIKTMMKKG
ncbi:MAG TPA: helix-turn-helix domain-containing protein [Puia sp.]|nr:helix-turn-helix domain-containing protein [Puia sp.]